jgi:hypothetical protein
MNLKALALSLLTLPADDSAVANNSRCGKR